MFDTCTIHIGTAKTGTTAVQNFLAMNRPALAARGFFYPSSLGQVVHSKLAAYAASDRKFEGGKRRVFRTDSDGAQEHRATIRARFLAEIAGVDCPNLVVSSEHLHFLLRTQAELRTLQALFQEVARKIRIVVYLRRQDRALVSVFSTAIKSGNTREALLTERLRTRKPYYYDYRQILGNYAEIFGRDNLIVRIFERDRLAGGDVIDDFCAAIGLAPIAGLPRPDKTNPSILPVAQKFLSVFNTHVPVMVNGKPNRLRGNVSKLIEQAYPGRGVTLSRAEARDFAAKFADDNEWVRQTWFPDQPRLFDDSFADYPETVAEQHFTFEDAVAVAADLWVASMGGAVAPRAVAPHSGTPRAGAAPTPAAAAERPRRGAQRAKTRPEPTAEQRAERQAARRAERRAGATP